MKRVVTSSSKSIKADSRFGTEYTVTSWHGLKCHDYFIRVYNEDDPSQLQLQISGIHPYDDASYAWARVESFRPTFAQIIQNGRRLSSVSMPSYVEEDWENFDEYVDEFVDRIIAELEEVNKDVQPKIMHF